VYVADVALLADRLCKLQSSGTVVGRWLGHAR